MYKIGKITTPTVIQQCQSVVGVGTAGVKQILFWLMKPLPNVLYEANHIFDCNTFTKLRGDQRF